ncbi:unnamed protein product [Mytilus edulis]|uniref:Uncharacterized protein n=1 Tax=Mytilus edulis TaxID=6550 RepID=A0A8S3V8E3_MYTED|nr:unnamed protein product [Mytilus edulis]
MSVLLEESTASDDESEDDNSNKIMKTVTGIICDVSASMRDNAEEHDITDEGGAWSRSVVYFIDDLIGNDDLKDSFVFAIGIGASCRDSTFDVLTTIEQFKDCKNTTKGLSLYEIVQKLFDILETGGARNIRKWATTGTVLQSISYDEASLFLNILISDKTFLQTFVYECLPSSCRD